MNITAHRLIDSLVVECWLRVRKVKSLIPSQGPRHTKDVIKMVPVDKEVMDKIWYENLSKSETQNRQKSNAKKQQNITVRVQFRTITKLLS